MGKVASDGIIDGGLTKVGLMVSLTVCAGAIAVVGDIVTNKLATVVIDGSDFTIANGDADGRKSTVGQQTSISITASGTADHVAIDDLTDFEVTTCTGQALTSGGTVTVPAWDIEISDPT